MPLSDPVLAVSHPTHHRLPMLDGWRALSILTVLAAHMLPLGPKRWDLNEAIAALGMAMFFTLSGFLIVSILQRDAAVGGLSPLLLSRPAAYLAAISYARYIVHPFSMLGWLGSGSGWAKYVKRPLCFALSFGVAHLSTFHFERRFVAWSHRITRRPSTPAAGAGR